MARRKKLPGIVVRGGRVTGGTEKQKREREKPKEKRKEERRVKLAGGERKPIQPIEAKKEGIVKPTIKAKKDKITVGGFVKELITGKGIKEKAEERGTGLKTGVVPITGLGGAAAILGKGKGLVTGGTARITRTATELKQFGKSLTTQRAFVGKSAQSGVNKIFHTVRLVASRFAVNPKSQGLTKSLFGKLGLSIGVVGLVVGAIGSYPFAGFIKEEALQTLGFAFTTAERNNDIEGMEAAIAETEELLNAAPTIIDKIPYANVQKQLKSFFEAAEVKLNIDKTRLEQARAEVEAGETAFQKERRESDEASFERKREFGEEESERFEGIREETEEREEREREESSQRFKDIAIENQELDIMKSQVFDLRRQGKFDEADQLEQQILERIKNR